MNVLILKSIPNNMIMNINIRKPYTITFKAFTTAEEKQKILIFNNGFDHLKEIYLYASLILLFIKTLTPRSV